MVISASALLLLRISFHGTEFRAKQGIESEGDVSFFENCVNLVRIDSLLEPVFAH